MSYRSIASYMNKLLSKVELSYLQKGISEAVAFSSEALGKIEEGFTLFTSADHDAEKRNAFFHSWSMTNNSAAGLSGFCNRLTYHVYNGQQVNDERALLRTVSSLHRVLDEDLGVTGGMVHWDMFYRMATAICGNDNWLSRRYLTAEAVAFKTWKDRQLLRQKDLMIGLLTTVGHEVYTHGEVEFILPKFQSWLSQVSTMDKKEQNRCLSWIFVHCGPTEQNHFFHALQAVKQYSQAFEMDVSSYPITEILTDYLTRKGEMMASLTAVLQGKAIAAQEILPEPKVV